MYIARKTIVPDPYEIIVLEMEPEDLLVLATALSLVDKDRIGSWLRFRFSAIKGEIRNMLDTMDAENPDLEEEYMPDEDN